MAHMASRTLGCGLILSNGSRVFNNHRRQGERREDVTGSFINTGDCGFFQQEHRHMNLDTPRRKKFSWQHQHRSLWITWSFNR